VLLPLKKQTLMLLLLKQLVHWLLNKQMLTLLLLKQLEHRLLKA
jgi:hypothetical protein